VQVLYEEEGELKVATVLGQAPASLQVESPHGRPRKVRAANVLLSFEQPAAAELLAQAQRFAEGLEVDFLWQCSGPAEFDFRSLARDYVGRETDRRRGGRSAPQAAPRTHVTSIVGARAASRRPRRRRSSSRSPPGKKEARGRAAGGLGGIARALRVPWSRSLR